MATTVTTTTAEPVLPNEGGQKKPLLQEYDLPLGSPVKPCV